MDGTGHTKITTAGLLVTAGGMTITAGGLHEKATGTTILAGGLGVVQAGATITNVGLFVMDGPSHTSNTAANAPALTVHASASSFSNTLLTVKTTREANAGFKLQEGFSNGVTKTNVNGIGVWTSVGGLVATTGGWTVSAGGLHSYQGTTIHTTGLQIPAAGATIQAGGLVVVADGANIKSTANGADVSVVQSSHTTYTGANLHLTYDRSSSLGSLFALELSSGSSLAQKWTVDGTGDVNHLSVTPSTSTTTGTMKSAGGIGVAKQLYVGGVMAALATTQSTSSTTGAIVIKGGLGVTDDLYIGGVLVIQNTNLEYNTISGDTDIVRSSDSDANRVSLILKRSRNSATSLSPVHSGDLLGKMQMDGYDGNSYEMASQIRTKVENSGTPVANNNMVSVEHEIFFQS